MWWYHIFSKVWFDKNGCIVECSGDFVADYGTQPRENHVVPSTQSTLPPISINGKSSVKPYVM